MAKKDIVYPSIPRSRNLTPTEQALIENIEILNGTRSAARSSRASATAGNAHKLHAPTDFVANTVITALQGWGWEVYVDLDWTAAQEATVERYEIQWKESANEWNEAYTWYETNNTALLRQIVWEKTYDFRVRSVAADGTTSSWAVILDHTVDKDDTAPALPTSIVVNGWDNQVSVRWKNPTEVDFRHVEIYISETDSIPAEATATSTSTFAFIDGLEVSKIYYVWVKSVDDSGNASDPSSSIRVVTVNVPNEHTYEQSVAPDTAEEGDYWIATLEDDKLYEWESGEWVAAIPPDVTGLALFAPNPQDDLEFLSEGMWATWVEPSSRALDYQVEIWWNSEMQRVSVNRRSTFLNKATFYSYTDAIDDDPDSSGAVDRIKDGARDLTIKVYARTPDGLVRSVNPAVLTVSNPQYGALAGVSVQANIFGSTVTYDVPEGTDLAGVEVHASETSGFTPSGSTLIKTVYDVTGNVNLSGLLNEETTYYIRVGAFDVWGKDGITYSTEQSITTTGPSSTTIFTGTSFPTGGKLNDLFIHEGQGNNQYVHNGGSSGTAANNWDDVQDSGIITAITNAASAQATADGKINIFQSDSRPTNAEASVGDLWTDTNDGFKVRVHNGGVADTLADWDLLTGALATKDSVSSAELESEALNRVMELNTASEIHTAGKSSFSNTTAGMWLGYSGGKYKFNFGDDTQFIKWDGTDLSISDMVVTAGSDTERTSIGIGKDVLNSMATGGKRNTAVGAEVLADLSTGDDNAAGGAYSLSNFDGAGRNTAWGAYSGDVLTNGVGNILIGYKANTGPSDDYSIVIASQTGFNTSASNNYSVAIGHYAGHNASGEYNVLLGANARTSSAMSGSYQLIIDSSSTPRSAPLIYGNFYDRWVYINGRMEVRAAGSENGDLHIQGDLTVDGTNNLTPAAHNQSASTITSGVLATARGGTGTSSSTGSGSNVRSASPALTGTPTITQKLAHSGDSDTYLQFDVNAFSLVAGNTTYLTSGYLGASWVGSDFLPTADNTHSLGANGARFSDIWAVDTTINSSDREMKKEIADSRLGSEFIYGLTPREFVWKHGSRTHYGLIAQEVRDLLDEQGIAHTDFAGYIFEAGDVTDATKPDTDTYGLRMAEFIAPIVATLQDQKALLDAALARIEHLENQ